MNENEAIEWIAELFEEPSEGLGRDTIREDVPAWDSMGALALIAEMDQKFGILLTGNQIAEMNEVGDILKVLEQNGKLS